MSNKLHTKPVPIAGYELTRLAVESEVNPATARRVLKGLPVRRSTKTALLAAAARLGWLDRLPRALTERAAVMDTPATQEPPKVD